MKLHALMIAVALAVGSTFALAANEGAGMGPNGASASTHESAAPARHMQKEKVSARHHRRHHRLHARAERREHMARAEHRMHMASRSSTRAMGAGRYSPRVDLNSTSRERRMDAAYNDWLRTQRR
jgi:hypothetical protein